MSGKESTLDKRTTISSPSPLQQPWVPHPIEPMGPGEISTPSSAARRSLAGKSSRVVSTGSAAGKKDEEPGGHQGFIKKFWRQRR